MLFWKTMKPKTSNMSPLHLRTKMKKPMRYKLKINSLKKT